ncbi:transporter substrate-binding domain-containing protein [Psychrobacter sp. FDAARGOS_221]|uniref:transporter substrate-binding domain-containing protein n=1 Tax=Psychrobacter sp. FDAARGOS_221 TaxID=1975705 RepID=UPI000BB53E90|nr:transporter substrate-binding domain-containing protein [Psychrobacter sp. FDAARGOS_221]PNK61085.1 ABC transporter substrate-binding protein [Psychrobacter sp. FDAARGOS_221]
MTFIKLNKQLSGKVLPALALAGVVGLAGCVKDDAETSTDAAATSAAGETIRVATEGAYPPFNYTNSDGSLGGFDVDVINAVCEEMQANCEVVSQDWDGIIPGLLANKYDAVIAGMSITPERAETVDFTEPYFSNTMVWLAKKDGTFSPDDITNKNLGSQRSTTLSEYLLNTYADKDGNEVKLYDTYENAYLELKSGRVDAVLAEKVSAADWLPENPDYVVIGEEIDNDDNLGIALRKNDPFKAEFNAAITTLRDNGTLAEIEAKNFGDGK